jgi:hypothetical protein
MAMVEYKMKLTNTGARGSAWNEGTCPDNTPLLGARSSELAKNAEREKQGLDRQNSNQYEGENTRFRELNPD